MLVCVMQVSHLDSSMIAAMLTHSVSRDDAFRGIIEVHILKYIGMHFIGVMYSALPTLLNCGMHFHSMHSCKDATSVKSHHSRLHAENE